MFSYNFYDIDTTNDVTERYQSSRTNPPPRRDSWSSDDVVIATATQGDEDSPPDKGTYSHRRHNFVPSESTFHHSEHEGDLNYEYTFEDEDEEDNNNNLPQNIVVQHHNNNHVDEDDFDFSHLMEGHVEEEDEEEFPTPPEHPQETDDGDGDGYVFEPYHDEETNRIVMRLRMTNLMNRQKQQSRHVQQQQYQAQQIYQQHYQENEEEDDDNDDFSESDSYENRQHSHPPTYSSPQLEYWQQSLQQQQQQHYEEDEEDSQDHHDGPTHAAAEYSYNYDEEEEQQHLQQLQQSFADNTTVAASSTVLESDLSLNGYPTDGWLKHHKPQLSPLPPTPKDYDENNDDNDDKGDDEQHFFNDNHNNNNRENDNNEKTNDDDQKNVTSCRDEVSTSKIPKPPLAEAVVAPSINHLEADVHTQSETSSFVPPQNQSKLPIPPPPPPPPPPPILCPSSASESTGVAITAIKEEEEEGETQQEESSISLPTKSQPPLLQPSQSSSQPQQQQQVMPPSHPTGSPQLQTQIDTVAPSSTTTKNENRNITKTLELYTDMIYSQEQTNLEGIRKLMVQNSALSEREITAFWIGIHCCVVQPSNPKQPTPPTVSQKKEIHNVRISPTTSDKENTATPGDVGDNIQTTHMTKQTPKTLPALKTTSSSNKSTATTTNTSHNGSGSSGILEDKQSMLKAFAATADSPSVKNSHNKKQHQQHSQQRYKRSNDHWKDDTLTSISVRSTMSCRELSIQRLRRRLKLNREAATSNTSALAPIASVNSTLSSPMNEEDNGLRTVNSKNTPSPKQQLQDGGTNNGSPVVVPNHTTKTSKVEELLAELQEAQSRQKRLEQQLERAGIAIAQDVPYQVAKDQVAKIARQMQAIGHSQIKLDNDPTRQAKLRQEYFVLEQEMEKYMTALELTDEYNQEQIGAELQWDEDNKDENRIALQRVWDHMPVNIRQRSVEEWTTTRTPSGRYLPKQFCLKFVRTNVLTLLRIDPQQIRKSHPSHLEQFRVTGLTLTERRAMETYLQPIAVKYWRDAADILTKRKWNWYNMLRQNFKSHLAAYTQHVQKYGNGKDHGEDDKEEKDSNGGDDITNNNNSNNGSTMTCSCSLIGLQCPVRSNQKLNYFDHEYGHPCDPQNPQYESLNSPVVVATKVGVKSPKHIGKGKSPRAGNKKNIAVQPMNHKLKKTDSDNNSGNGPSSSAPPPQHRRSLLDEIALAKRKSSTKKQIAAGSDGDQKKDMQRPSLPTSSNRSLLDEIAAVKRKSSLKKIPTTDSGSDNNIANATKQPQRQPRPLSQSLPAKLPPKNFLAELQARSKS